MSIKKFRNFSRFAAATLLSVMTLASVSQPVAAQGGGEPIATATPGPNTDLPGMVTPDAPLSTVVTKPVEVGAGEVTTTTSGITMTDGLAMGWRYDLEHFAPIDSALAPSHGFQLTAVSGNSIMAVAPVMPAVTPIGSGNSHVVNVRIVIYTNSYNYLWQYSRINELKAWLETGSRWKGYGVQSMMYNITAQTTMHNYSMSLLMLPNGNGNVATMMSHAQNSCAAIQASNVPTEVWVFADTRYHLGEFMINGPKYNNAFTTSHNMPNCGKQYTVFGYAYAGEDVEGSNNWHTIVNSNALHDHGHYWEWMLTNSAQMGYHKIACNAVSSTNGINGGNPATQYYNSSTSYGTPVTVIQDLYECADLVQPQSLANRVNFMTRATAQNGNGAWVAAGSIHYPPPSTSNNDLPSGPPNYGAYNYCPSGGAASMVTTWWVQSPNYTFITGNTWGCTPEGFYVWWMQFIPTYDSEAYDRTGSQGGYWCAVTCSHNGWRGIKWIL